MTGGERRTGAAPVTGDPRRTDGGPVTGGERRTGGASVTGGPRRTDGGSVTGGERPFFSVVAGRPTPEELAALTAALLTVTRRRWAERADVVRPVHWRPQAPRSACSWQRPRDDWAGVA
ncbi:acyl-CoA carboxylase epsilon subunit [Actinoallomurus sp. CA-150999]|uniref:acyl-CoA carboxylase epsilon subunit n=1 Tax=Actinoallomurus sp. CA-150999 TaxID=3239887 RepID=UPI003D8C383B